MKQKIATFCSVIAVATMSSQANAAVLYEFELFSSFELTNGGEEFTSGEFSFTAPTFVSSVSQTIVPVGDLLSCSIITNLETGTCRDHTMDPEFELGTDMIRFGFETSLNAGTRFYHFADGAFNTAGIYDSIRFGDSQAGRLTVTDLAAGGVPEPATWGMMIFGFGLIGGAMRRQRKANVKVNFI
ncbi:MAG: PEPxxWA-CTERM sorting domain-containing protein [Parasphingorhabdus sp.]|uniref:PEPxxWA-CTERM sorting domain-containing protein n=3 Tax=Parasphingorhabdus sp. TaxID=2709688 RepID=UPI003267D549